MTIAGFRRAASGSLRVRRQGPFRPDRGLRRQGPVKLVVVLDQRCEPPDSSPSLPARVLAFAAIVVAGVCGGLIGFAVMDLGCDGGCTIAAGLVGLGTAAGAAAGTGVVAVLALMASAEWRAQQSRDEAGPPTGRSGSRPGP